MVENVLKPFIIKQFSIGRSTLYNILKTEENFKKFSRKRWAEILLFLCIIQAVVSFYEEHVFCTYPDMFIEKFCPTCPDKWINTVC